MNRLALDNRRIFKRSVEIFLLLLGFCLLSLTAGCGSGFQGESVTTTTSGSQETMKINNDGSYDQQITCASGKIWQKSGKWETVKPYILVRQAYDPSTCCSIKTGTPGLKDTYRAQSQFESDGGQTNENSVPQSKQAAILQWAIAIRLILLVIWVLSLIDIVGRDFGSGGAKFMWILCVTLLGCLGTILYWFVGRSTAR